MDNSTIASGTRQIDPVSNPWDWETAVFNSKRYENFEIKEDLLALSVAWHRIRKDPDAPRPSSLTDNILFESVTPDDKIKANEIRDYYSKKIMLIVLRDEPLSKFRKDLNTFVHGPSRIFKEETMPLVYRLPEFYEHDNSLDEMFKKLNTKFESKSAIWQVQPLTPIKKFAVNRKIRKYTEYWLKDDLNRSYTLTVNNDNELKHIWDYLFEQETIKMDAVSVFLKRDNISFFKIRKWKIVF